MYRYEEIRQVHLEPTTRCNAACPMCARNTRGVTAPGLALTDLSLESFKKIFPEELLARLTALDLCGSYGDPALATDLIEIITYARHINPQCAISTYTNGGVRSPHWWQRLARAATPPAHVVFAIDGLEDTNGVYRRGVIFSRVIANAKAFISAGGSARWEFLIFRHNAHEVESARTLSTELGFESFSVKRTARFMDAIFDHIPEVYDQHDLAKFPIYSAGGAVVGHLRPAEDSMWTSDVAAQYGEPGYGQDRLASLLSETPIRCRAQNTKSVFVSAPGHAFPCPWTYVQATRPTQSRFPPEANWQTRELLDRSGGFDGIHALRVGLRTAVEGPFFAAIASSWSCPSISGGRLQICARPCGTAVSAHFEEFDDHKRRLPSSEQPQ